MRRLVLLVLVAALVPGVCAAQGDTAKLTVKDLYKNIFHIDTSTAISGTWTGSVNTTQLAEVAGGAAGDAQNELAAGDIILVGGYSYRVAIEPPDANTIIIVPARDPSTGALKAGLDATVTAQTVYLINHGITGTSETVLDGAGTSTALSLSTTTVGAAALEVGGGYTAGGSGASVSAAGVVQANGAISSDGAFTSGVDAAGGTPNTAGQVKLFSAGDNAFYATLTAPTLSSNAAFLIPVDEPGAESWLTMGTDGQVDYTTISGETLAAVTARGATTSTATSLTGGLDLGADDDASNVVMHDASTLQIWDDSDDTSVTIGPVTNGTTTLGVTGTINASGLQVGGAAVLTAEAQTLAAVTALGATTTTAVGLNGGFSVDTPAFVVADTTGALSTTAAPTVGFSSSGTTDTEYLIFQDNQQAAKTTVAAPYTTATSNAITWNWYADTEAVANWTLKEAARIAAYAEGDWEDDAGAWAAADSGMQFWTSANGTPALRWYIDSTGALVLGPDSNKYWDATGKISALDVEMRVADLVGRFLSSGTTYDGDGASHMNMGVDGMLLEGATDDTDELKLSFPSYSDGGAGNQGGEYDATSVVQMAREATITIPSGDPDGDAHAAYTLTPTAYTSVYSITCSDDDGCTLTLAEVDLGSVAIHGGHQITIIQATTNYHLDLADAAGSPAQLAGAWAPTTTGDAITLVYSTSLSEWVETGRSDN